MSQPRTKNTLVLAAVQELQETCTPVTRARLVRYLFELDPTAWSIPGDLGLPDSKRVDACLSKLIQRGHLDHVGPSEYEAIVRKPKIAPGALPPGTAAPPPPSTPLRPDEVNRLRTLLRSATVAKAKRGGVPLNLNDARSLLGGSDAELHVRARDALDLCRRAMLDPAVVDPKATDVASLTPILTVLRAIVEKAIPSG